MTAQNNIKYGLSREYIDSINLPKPSTIKVLKVDDILNARRAMTTSEKISHL